jgi:hypothetical protein
VASAGWWRALPIGAGVAAILVSSCSADYRINVKPIPEGAQALLVASYVNDTIATQGQPFSINDGQINPGDASYSFGLDQKPQADGTVHISVGALDANNCLLAVGSAVETGTTNASSDSTSLFLDTPNPILTQCPTTATPSIIDITRNIQGSLRYETYSLKIQGWGFLPTATVDIRSSAVVRCDPRQTQSACYMRCQYTSDCASYDSSSGNQTNQFCMCSIEFDPTLDVLHVGPATIIVILHPEANVLQESDGMRPPIGLADLTSRPLTVTVTNPGAAPIKQTEADQLMPDMAGADLSPPPDMAMPDL